jgi:hypothetical protein
VLFLLKTTPKPPKNNQYQNTKSKQFVPNLISNHTGILKPKQNQNPCTYFCNKRSQ